MSEDFLANDGEMGSLMRSLDWSNCSIGPFEQWSPSLRTLVRMMLANRYPMLIFWGSQLVQIYNEGCLPILGIKHPKAMGQRAVECWPEAWHAIGSSLERVLSTKQAVRADDLLLYINRKGFLEECHFTFSYSPIPDEAGNIEGIMVTASEITDRVLSERRLSTLSNLATRTAEVKIAEETCKVSTEVLARATEEIILERITDALVAYDRDWRFTYANSAAARIMRKTPAEVIGKTLWEVFPDIIGTRFEREYLRAMTEQVPVEFEECYQPYNIWLEARFYPSPTGLSGFFRDVTDRKRTEKALAKSESLYRAIGETIDYGIWICEPDGRNIYASESFLRLVGITQEQCSNFGWGDVLHPDDAPATIAAWQECVRTGNFWDIEHRFRGVDGNWHPILARGVPIRDENGAIVCWAGINLDISSLKHVEAQLRTSEERFQLATRAVDGIVYDWNVQTGEVYRSEGLYRLLGVRPEDVPQTEDWWGERVHPDDRAKVELAWKNLLIGGLSRHDVEYRVRHEDGRWIDVWDRGYPIRDGDGQVMRLVGSTADISARKQAEAERDRLLQQEQAARAEAESANRIKDEFLAVLSHELRSPLNPILGWSRLLQTRKLDEAKTARALETIERNAKLQSDLIEDLLDVSRILQGKLNLNVSPVDLVAVVEAAAETVRLAAEAKSIEIKFQISDFRLPIENLNHPLNLKSEISNLKFLVAGDPNRLQQVIWNLLSNAVKFTPTGGRIKVCLERVGIDVQIEIEDTGKGIAPEFLPYVFDYFRQEDGKTTRKFGGLGLGLAIVRHLVELHGGTVRADSRGEGFGATFTVKLPLMPDRAQTSEESAPSERALNLNGIRVLIADDDTDTREFITFLLEESGAETIAASSADEAFKILTQFQPDLLLSDIGMPDMDGYMLVRRVRSLPPERGGKIPAIALTAYAGEFDRNQALQAGFQLHLAKPVEPEALVRAIVHLLARAR